jgi:hypothetical protein
VPVKKLLRKNTEKEKRKLSNIFYLFLVHTQRSNGRSLSNIYLLQGVYTNRDDLSLSVEGGKLKTEQREKASNKKELLLLCKQ